MIACLVYIKIELMKDGWVDGLMDGLVGGWLNGLID